MSSVVPLRSSSCQSPDLVLSRPFPSVLTTMAFDHSRRRWFGTCSCQPVPRGLPSSIKQLHTLGPPRPFALVAHDRRRSAVLGSGSRLPIRPRSSLSEPCHPPPGETAHRPRTLAGKPAPCRHYERTPRRIPEGKSGRHASAATVRATDRPPHPHFHASPDTAAASA